ncbi:U6 snRNA phosphodiesterase Usb1 [Chytriomyces sp. MP71]|nr:U6 snRNA phosphodiesterase Usb1 [Chytriomyces sp. MP71]
MSLKRKLVPAYSSESETEAETETGAQAQAAADNVAAQTETAANPVQAKKKKLPAPVLPDATANKYKEKVQQRLAHRSGVAKHVEFIPGNWSTIVYVAFSPSQELSRVISESLDSAQLHYPDLKLMKVSHSDSSPNSIDGSPSMLHISCSRTVFLKEFQISRFIDLLRSRLRLHKSFTVSLQEFNSYINDDGSKTFLSMDVGAGANELTDLTSDVNRVLKEFSQPEFYEKPEFHASIGYFVNDHSPEVESLSGKECPSAPKLNMLDLQLPLDSNPHAPKRLQNQLREQFSASRIPSQFASFTVRKVSCKTGNQVFHIPLA